MTEQIKTLEITIDIDQMTIGDLELLERAGQSELKMTELIDFLDRVVEEDVRTLPITELGNIVKALNAAVGEASNPETAEGN